MALSVVILAAGKGSRMKSTLPKVLHPLGGKPLLAHVITCAKQLNPDNIIVVHGHGGDQVRQAMESLELADGLQWVEQAEQLGTGHAVAQATPLINDDHTVLVLYGDVPLIRYDTLRTLLANVGPQSLALLTVTLDDPTGYGRIVRGDDKCVHAIVEQKDASDDQLAITEVNTGILAVTAEHLQRWLPLLKSNNAQGEYYLTDIIGLAANEKLTIAASQPADTVETEGINDRVQLARIERCYQRQQAEVLMLDGVTLADPDRIDVRGTVRCGRDVTIDINVVLEGDVVIEDGVTIGANTIIIDSVVGKGTIIKPNCLLEGTETSDFAEIGPFARLRPGTRLRSRAKIGNFVETKKSTVGCDSKVNHFTYVGDAEIGDHVNIGAGTITCNYDGANKHKTVIGDNVFIGSNSSLVAPVTIEKDATIGAGSTVTRTAPAGRLTLTRAKQVTIENWKRPKKL